MTLTSASMYARYNFLLLSTNSISTVFYGLFSNAGRKHISSYSLDNPFSENNRERTCQYISHLNKLRWTWKLKRKSSRLANKQSAVLIALCEINNQPSVLFTLRSRKVGSHKGQVRYIILLDYICCYIISRTLL